jgi:hypothetical protein
MENYTRPCVVRVASAPARVPDNHPLFRRGMDCSGGREALWTSWQGRFGAGVAVNFVFNAITLADVRGYIPGGNPK